MQNPILHRAILLYSQHRHELAEQELRRLLTEQPEDAEALGWLGLCLVKQKKYDEAEQATQAAIGHAPDMGFCYYAHAWVLHDRNKLSEAEKAIAEALKQDPYTPSYLALQSQFFADRKNWSEALASAEEGLAIDPENVECNNLRAMALVSLGRKKEAAASLHTTLQTDPEEAVTHANLGWTYLDQGQVEKAIEHFRESLRLDATLEWAQTGLIEAIKARFWPYRVLLRFFLWMNKLDDRIKLVILLGGFFGNQLLRSLAADYPVLAPWITPITTAYIILVLLTWFGVPLANLCLMTHPFGRMALKPRDQRIALLIGGFLLAMLVSYITYLRTDDILYSVIFVMLFMFLFPMMSWHMAPEGRPRLMMFIYMMALAGLGLFILFNWVRNPMLDLMTAYNIYRYGCIASQFIIQFFPFHREVR
jgi:Flp pilus assembly protein TadD